MRLVPVCDVAPSHAYTPPSPPLASPPFLFHTQFCANEMDILALLKLGESCRHASFTQMNAVSSRSHRSALHRNERGCVECTRRPNGHPRTLPLPQPRWERCPNRVSFSFLHPFAARMRTLKKRCTRFFPSFLALPPHCPQRLHGVPEPEDARRLVALRQAQSSRLGRLREDRQDRSARPSLPSPARLQCNSSESSVLGRLRPSCMSRQYSRRGW